MKLCYCDESGTGDEPIAVMVGVLVDAQRMHITKDDWHELLEGLSRVSGREVSELHTRDFYSGNSVWRKLDGELRAEIISMIFGWIAERKHHLVVTSVRKDRYRENRSRKRIPSELGNEWRFMGFHLALAVQKYCKKHEKNKGHTILVFDNEDREKARFTDVLMRPPDWSREYYGGKAKDRPLDQIVDVPYFGDSKEVALIQVADFVAFFMRRYAEIKEGLSDPRYHDEEDKVNNWVASLRKRLVGSNFTYKKTGRCPADELFFENAPRSIRQL